MNQVRLPQVLLALFCFLVSSLKAESFNIGYVSSGGNIAVAHAITTDVIISIVNIDLNKEVAYVSLFTPDLNTCIAEHTGVRVGLLNGGVYVENLPAGNYKIEVSDLLWGVNGPDGQPATGEAVESDGTFVYSKVWLWSAGGMTISPPSFLPMPEPGEPTPDFFNDWELPMITYSFQENNVYGYSYAFLAFSVY